MLSTNALNNLFNHNVHITGGLFIDCSHYEYTEIDVPWFLMFMEGLENDGKLTIKEVSTANFKFYHDKLAKIHVYEKI